MAKSKGRESVVGKLPVPSPVSGFAVADMRKQFAKVTKETPRDAKAESAFIASKLHMLRTHPALHLTARKTLTTAFAGRLKKQLAKKYTGPPPGGVGYGVFYNDSFKTNFATGTAIYWEIICPNPPGGNVTTFLYLTATNRSVKGVEAFIAYNGQNQTFFKVFDWARSDQWQTNIPFANLGSYVRTESSHGNPYRVLPLMNVTAQSGANSWYNQVWLWNHDANRWDLIYQYGYSATLADQQTGWVGSWGPIIETFQDSYQNTNPMGALNVQLLSRDGNNQWGAWHFLSPADSYVRTDNKGFHLLFLDANYNLAVVS
jgi:hypothetical protein